MQSLATQIDIKKIGIHFKFRETIREIDKEITNTRGFFARIEPKLRKFLTKNALKQREIQELKNTAPNKILLKTQSQIVETVFHQFMIVVVA